MAKAPASPDPKPAVVTTAGDPAVAQVATGARVAINPDAAQSSGRALGDQVTPATQLREDDGNRTLAQPVTDPGPVTLNENGEPVEGKYPGSPLAATEPNYRRFDPLTITQRVGTKPHDDAELAVVDMSADMVTQHGASDMYHKEGRNNDGRNPVAENAVKDRVVAPTKE